jgi:hypothetical protein
MKNLPYWLKSGVFVGIVGGIIATVLLVTGFIGMYMEGLIGFLIPFYGILFGLLYKFSNSGISYFLITLIYNLVLFFVIGSVIGFLFGKFKNRDSSSLHYGGAMKKILYFIVAVGSSLLAFPMTSLIFGEECRSLCSISSMGFLIFISMGIFAIPFLILVIAAVALGVMIEKKTQKIWKAVLVVAIVPFLTISISLSYLISNAMQQRVPDESMEYLQNLD